MSQENIIDRVNNDDNKIVITTGSVKWLIGLITTGVIGILGFAYGLYVSTQNDLQTKHDDVVEMFEELKNVDVKDNTKTNNAQNVDIGRLYERTDSKNIINNGAVRPTTTNGPTIP